MKLSQLSAWWVVLLGNTLAGSVAGSNASEPWELNSGSILLWHTWHKSDGPQSDVYHSPEGASLAFTRVRKTDAGQDPVPATSGAGAAASFTVTLTGIIPLMLPTITSQPQDQTTTIGGFASFSVTALDAEPLTYQWLKNGVSIPGATSATLTLNNLLTADAGLYTVVVSNTDGPVSSNPATLQIILSPGPLFASPKWNQTTGFSTTLRGQLQASGRVQMSTNLVDWVDLANITSSGGVTQIVDPGAANAPRRFYRAVITP